VWIAENTSVVICGDRPMSIKAVTDFVGQNLPSRGTGVQLVKKFSASYIKKVFTITMQFEVLA